MAQVIEMPIDLLQEIYGLDCLISGLECLISGPDCLIYGLDCLICSFDYLFYGLDCLIQRVILKPNPGDRDADLGGGPQDKTMSKAFDSSTRRVTYPESYITKYTTYTKSNSEV